MTIRQLDPDEMVRLGDLVTVARDASEGHRPLQGLVDIPAGEYSYPIYRNDVECDHEYEVQDGSYDHEFGCKTVLCLECVHCGVCKPHD